LNLLFIGDTNRVVSETPKNDASTRSHCIFIIMIETKKPNSDVKSVARLHLVDLSGSERIGKTGVTGLLEKEARFINQSLHYLELVIVCLNKRANGENIHVPYRNSLMTLVLRDSLGGNCKTRMIATVSNEE
jgi:kinesin family protein 6/9